LLCWTLLDFDQKSCRWRRKIGYLACRLQPSEQPSSALFRSTGTSGATGDKNRSKRVLTIAESSQIDRQDVVWRVGCDWTTRTVHITDDGIFNKGQELHFSGATSPSLNSSSQQLSSRRTAEDHACILSRR
jgi:hypothetical protein